MAGGWVNKTTHKPAFFVVLQYQASRKCVWWKSCTEAFFRFPWTRIIDGPDFEVRIIGALLYTSTSYIHTWTYLGNTRPRDTGNVLSSYQWRRAALRQVSQLSCSNYPADSALLINYCASLLRSILDLVAAESVAVALTLFRQVLMRSILTDSVKSVIEYLGQCNMRIRSGIF